MMLTQGTVLVIEDHADTCELLKEMFQRHGLIAECAAKFEEGVTIARVRRNKGKPFSCVLTDLCLPDSTAAQTVQRICDLAFDNTPVRAISRVADPSIIKSCRQFGIRLILKGTSAEGILESVLYAIADHAPAPEIDDMIAKNRPHVRELVPRTSFGFWSNWSSQWKGITVAATILTMASTAVLLGGTLYKTLEDKVVGQEKNRERFSLIDAELARNKEERVNAAIRVRTVEDANIKIQTKLDYQQEQLNRIETKLDRPR